jgi:phosphate transport system substrate-binding protein
MVPARTTEPSTPVPTTPGPAATPFQPVAFAGKIRVTGSTTVLPIAQKEADAYMDKNLKADIQVSGGGSSVGVQAAGAGTAEIGMSSRELSDSEKAKYADLVVHTVARDAIVVIVHPSNPVNTLTLDQVRGLYNGTFQGWNNVGGTMTFPVLIGRDSASGTRVYFTETVMKNEKYRPEMREMNSNGAVKQTVAQTPGAIGYVGLGYVDSTVKAVKIYSRGEAISPGIETVLNGKYPISRALYMLTRGQPTGLARDYLDFILSPEGQKIVRDEGFVPLA